ncbi:unnamed protein product, partial [Rotaria magnacalcarata]
KQLQQCQLPQQTQHWPLQQLQRLLQQRLQYLSRLQQQQALPHGRKKDLSSYYYFFK